MIGTRGTTDSETLSLKWEKRAGIDRVSVRRSLDSLTREQRGGRGNHGATRMARPSQDPVPAARGQITLDTTGHECLPDNIAVQLR